VLCKFGEKKSRWFGNFVEKKCRCSGNLEENNNVDALEIRKKEIVIQNFGIDFLIKRISKVQNFQNRIAFINTSHEFSL